MGEGGEASDRVARHAERGVSIFGRQRRIVLVWVALFALFVTSLLGTDVAIVAGQQSTPPTTTTVPDQAGSETSTTTTTEPRPATPETTTTTPATTTTRPPDTIAPGATSVPSTSPPPAPAGSSPDRALPESGHTDEGAQEAVATEDPPPPVVVPPPEIPPVASPEQALIDETIAATLEQARFALSVALGLEAQAAEEVAGAEKAVTDAQAAIDQLRAEERDAVLDLLAQRERVQRWAVDAYTGGSLRRAAFVLESQDIHDASRRFRLAKVAARVLADSLIAQERALARASRQQQALAEQLMAADQRLVAAQAASVEATGRVMARRQEVDSLDAGRTAAAAATGVAFPVLGPVRFSDTWGAARMIGTAFAHSHQGADIFAPRGSPMVAFERGVVTGIGTDVLGGIKVWLLGQSGTSYYYAHAQGYAEGLADGQVVEVGQTLGYVGNSGNAVTTPPHLHFEVHPGGGPAVNPYPMLVQILQAARAPEVTPGSPAQP